MRFLAVTLNPFELRDLLRETERALARSSSIVLLTSSYAGAADHAGSWGGRGIGTCGGETVLVACGPFANASATLDLVPI